MQADLTGIQDLWKEAMDKGEASEMDNYSWIGTALDQDKVCYLELVMPYETANVKEDKKAS